MTHVLRCFALVAILLATGPTFALKKEACNQLLGVLPRPTKLPELNEHHTQDAFTNLKRFRQLVFPSITSPAPLPIGEIQLIKSNFGTARTRVAGGYIKELEDAFAKREPGDERFLGRVYEGDKEILDMATKIGAVREKFARETRYGWGKMIRLAALAPVVSTGAIFLLKSFAPGLDPNALLALSLGSGALPGALAYRAGMVLDEPFYDPQLAIQTIVHDPGRRDFVLIHGETADRIMDIVAYVDDQRRKTLTVFQRPRPKLLQ